jgi:hypothetical protein
MWQPNNSGPPPPLGALGALGMGMAGGVVGGGGGGGGGMGMGMGMGGGMMNNGVDWGQAAQQWLRNKEMYEQWQQQQYQMMMAAQAAAHAASMASCIDPTVVTNPPPPPPESSELDAVAATTSSTNTEAAGGSNDDSLNSSTIPPLMGGSNNTPNRKVSQFKSRFANSPQFNANNTQQQDQAAKGKSLFAAYDTPNNQQENGSKVRINQFI